MGENAGAGLDPALISITFNRKGCRCRITMISYFSDVCIKSLLTGTAFFLALFCVSGCSSFRNHPDDDWFGRDKLYHFTATAVIGAGTAAAAYNNGIDNTGAPAAGISASLVIGAGKEWYDVRIKEKYWSWKDMVWDMIGGCAGSCAVAAWR